MQELSGIPTCSLLEQRAGWTSSPSASWLELKSSPLSPSSPTEVYAQLCNVARIEAEREAGIHFRPGYEYSPGPDDLPYNLYGPDGPPFYNYLGPEDSVPEPPFSNVAGQLGENTPVLEPPLQPSELQPRYVASHSGMQRRWDFFSLHPLHLPASYVAGG